MRNLEKNIVNRGTRFDIGITLISLVITVIVMLIISGVAIKVITNSDGIFNKTKTGVDDYNQRITEEMDELTKWLGSLEKNFYPLGKTVFVENKTFSGEVEGDYNNPIIPRGFYPVNDNGAVWGSDDGYKKGLIIEDANENQYVWVPVDGNIVKLEQIEWKDANGKFYGYGDKLSDYTDSIPDTIKQSISKNKGFYIARFEAGISNEMKLAIEKNKGKEITVLPEAEDTTNTYGNGSYMPVSKQGAIVWNNIAFNNASGNGALKVVSNLYHENDTNYGVVSTLNYGACWDAALKFISAYSVGENGYEVYPIDSNGMGNYSGTNGEDTFTGITNCGAGREFSQKNIYDMAGNVLEWTLETYESRFVGRSGYYGCTASEFPAAGRNGGGEPSMSLDSLGFRVMLYIKL